MSKRVSKITVYFKGRFHGVDYWDVQTFKELIETYGLRRSQIISWVKAYH